MGNVAIVTDSTAHVPKGHFDGLPISIIPLHITWGDQSYRDGIDITPEDFFQRLRTDKDTPHTSQIPLQEFIALYTNLLERGFDILSIHVSGRVSNTLDMARQAARELGAVDKISTVDSLTSSAATAFQVIGAARAAIVGATLAECKRIAEKIRERAHIYFVPGALDSLYRGGRIGGAAAFFGSVLKILPILEPREGVIAAIERARTMRHAMHRIVELFEVSIKDGNRLVIAGLYADLPELADQLLDMIRSRIHPERIVQIFTTTISPALGVHIGPGSVGLAFMQSPE